MTQKYNDAFDFYSENWSEVGPKLNDFFKTIFSLNAGEDPPSNPIQGMPWLDISEGWNDAVLKFYNGNEWVLAHEYSPYIKDLKLATGSKEKLWERLEVALNEDGTLKAEAAENLTEWVDSGLTPTYTADNEFEVDGDQTDIFVENRKIKATLDSSLVYSFIESSSYDSFNDITNVTLENSVLDSTVQKIEHGLVKPGNEGSQPKPIYKDEESGVEYSLKVVDGSLALEEV